MSSVPSSFGVDFIDFSYKFHIFSLDYLFVDGAQF